MGRSASTINLFEYLDYRQFLKDWYETQKKERQSFSFRLFSKRAGFESPNFYKLVMDGDRNLTEKSLEKFMVGLKLNKQEQEFFRNLVFYSQAADHEHKNHYYQLLLRSRKFNQIKPVEKDHYEFYDKWYHSVVRELVTSPDFDGTPKWLADRICPRISEKLAEKSILLLEKIGFIKRNKEGQFVQSDPLITTGDEPSSLVILNYHQNMLALARESLPHIKASNREVSSMTLGVKKERIPQLKKKVQEFRKDILKMVADDTSAEEVVFMNIQMIPVTRQE